MVTMGRRLWLSVRDKRVLAPGFYIALVVAIPIALLVELRLDYYGPGSANMHSPDRPGMANVQHADCPTC